MTGVRRSLTYTKADAAIEALSAESQSIQEGGPPDRAAKSSSVGDRRKDEEADDSGEAESDSGDSLFITQKPVPEAVRSVERRRRSSLRSDPSSPPDLDESADDSSSSDSLEEAKPKRPRRKTTKLPKFNFSFLKVTGRKANAKRGFLTAGQNITLHTHVMGGFFINVRELSEGHQQRSLPTVDKEGEDISPLSEEEEGGSESEDMKVVERKRFVGRSKCSQPWCMKSSNVSQEGQKKKMDEAPAKAATSRVPALSSDTVLETETGNKHVTSDGNTVAQSETSRTNGQFTNGNKNIVLQEEENEKELCEDSDATFCEALGLGSPEAQEHPEEYTLNSRDASPLRTEPQADVFHTENLLQTGQDEDIPDSQTLLHSFPDLIIDSNYNGLHTEPRVKKKRKKNAKGVHEGVEGEKNQSREEPKEQHTAVPVSLETEEIPSLSEDNPAEPPAPQTGDEPEPNEKNLSHDDIALREGERHSPDSKQIKKKRKKRSAADNGGQEQDGRVETDVRLESGSPLPVICDVVNDNKVEERKKKKKKKRERNAESEEGIEQLQLSTVAEAASDDVETQGNKKKRKKEKMVVNMGEPEEAVNTTSDQPLTSGGQIEERERLETDKKRKKKKKQMSGSNDDVQVGGEGGADQGSPNDVNLESTEQSMKKKKKKNKKKESIPEEDISSTPDKSKKVNGAGDSQTTEEGPNGQDAEVVSKEKKKKKKRSEIFSRKVSEDALTQIDDSVSVQKKKKKRTSSFLVADAEEKDSQTQDKQSSTSVAAHVWDAQKPIVSAGDVETESAKITGNVEASNDGSRKKKRKREISVAQESTEQDHEQDFKKPKEICLSCLPETTDTGVKKKKKKKRSDSESVTSIETFISSSEAGYPTDEAVTLKKKKKKKKETQQSPAAAFDDAESVEALQRSWSSHSHKGKDKQSIFTPPSPVANDVKEKKKKKKVKSTDDVLLESEPSTECAKIKTHKTEKKKRNKLTSAPSVTSSSKEDVSDCVSKNKSKKAKRKLYNPDVGFLIDG